MPARSMHDAVTTVRKSASHHSRKRSWSASSELRLAFRLAFLEFSSTTACRSPAASIHLQNVEGAGPGSEERGSESG